MKIYLRFAAAITVLFYSACRSDEKTSWDIDVIAPLAETRLGLDNLLADSNIISAPGEPLVVRFESNLSLLPTDSIFSIPDTIIGNSFSLPISFNLPSGFQLVNLNDLVRFDYGNLSITDVILASGTLKSTITSRLDDPVVYSFAIPQAYFSAVPLQLQNQQLDPASVSNPITRETTTDLSNYSFNLRGPNNNESNLLQLTFSARLDPNGNGAPVSANVPALEYSNEFLNFKPYFAKGFFGNQKFTNENQRISVAFLRRVTGNLDLEDATMDLFLENSVGADFSFLIRKFKALKSSSGVSLDLEHSLIGQQQLLARSTNFSVYPPSFSTTTKSFQLNSSNSNLKEVLEMLPDEFEYSLDAELNPLGNVSSGNDFIFNTSNAKASFALTMPFKFAANALYFTDTIKTTGFEESDQSPVTNASLFLAIENGFPFDLKCSFDLLDENRVKIDTLLPNDIAVAGIVDASLRVRQSTETIMETRVTPQRLENLERTRYIVVKAKLNTLPEQTRLPMYLDYFLRVQLRGKGLVRINL
jgi:hypothetical protein